MLKLNKGIAALQLNVVDLAELRKMVVQHNLTSVFRQLSYIQTTGHYYYLNKTYTLE